MLVKNGVKRRDSEEASRPASPFSSSSQSNGGIAYRRRLASRISKRAQSWLCHTLGPSCGVRDIMQRWQINNLKKTNTGCVFKSSSSSRACCRVKPLLGRHGSTGCRRNRCARWHVGRAARNEVGRFLICCPPTPRHPNLHTSERCSLAERCGEAKCWNADAGSAKMRTCRDDERLHSHIGVWRRGNRSFFSPPFLSLLLSFSNFRCIILSR